MSGRKSKGRTPSQKAGSAAPCPGTNFERGFTVKGRLGSLAHGQTLSVPVVRRTVNGGISLQFVDMPPAACETHHQGASAVRAGKRSAPDAQVSPSVAPVFVERGLLSAAGRAAEAEAEVGEFAEQVWAFSSAEARREFVEGRAKKMVRCLLRLATLM